MKKLEIEKEVKLESLLKDAETHPLMQQIVKEKEAATLATRKEAGAKIESLMIEWDKVISDLQTDLSVKEAGYQTAKAQLEAAQAEFQKAKFSLSQESLSRENEINRQKDLLIETADPRIDEAIEFFQKKLEWLRTPGRIGHIAGGSKLNIISWTKTVKGESNWNAVREALSYCQAAIKALENLKLIPEFNEKAVEELKAGVPSIDRFEEVTGEKPMKKIADPKHAFKSDSQHDWEMSKLTEKFKKVIGR